MIFALDHIVAQCTGIVVLMKPSTTIGEMPTADLVRVIFRLVAKLLLQNM